MKHSAQIMQELETISPFLAAATKHTPYTVDASYFEALPYLILAQLDLPAPTMEVPTGYFDQLPQQLLQKIHSQAITDELNTVAPVLNTISKIVPYQVPEQYFEQLQPIRGKTGANVGKVIAMPAAKLVLRWAAAAVVVLGLGFGGQWLLRFNDATPETAQTTGPAMDTAADAAATAAVFAGIDDTTLTAYVQQQLDPQDTEPNTIYLTIPDNFESALQNFSAADLEAHINNTPEIPKNG